MKQQIMADGRVAINLAGYSIFAEKKLSLDQLQDVTKNLNELNSLVEKSDKDKLDEEERKRLRAIAMYLGKTYKISNITGKKVSMMIPGGKK
jgi:CRISPR/Cas system-associated endonuclease/helicase Cas3|tara:strand:+ start:73 stop:348 length:276 start_codon:yes stop_codon:yes gene_type:complete